MQISDDIQIETLYNGQPIASEGTTEASTEARRTRTSKTSSKPAKKASTRKASSPAHSPKTAQPLGVLAQVSAATSRPVALAIGATVGGFVPIASFMLAHHEAPTRPVLWALVAAALIFSGLSVYEWTSKAFGSRLKALGFVILTEGIMLSTGNQYLAFAALALLVGINATATGAHLATERRQSQC